MMRFSRTLAAVLAASLGLGVGLPARAHARPHPKADRPPAPADPDSPDGDIVEPGPEKEPPGPDDGDEKVPPLDTDPGQRRAIKGAPVDDLPPEDPHKKAMREFEEQAFPHGDPGDTGRSDEQRTPAPEHHGATRPKEELPPELTSPPRSTTHRAPPAHPEEVRPDLPWLKGLATGDLPVRWDPRVIRFLEFYRDDPRGHAIMGDWLREQGKYKKLILGELRRAHLPEDLIYVCMIESSYNPRDSSYAGASGLWQFMPEGGKIYGMRRDYWVDERNDPEKSTHAQMLYFHDLYDRFGDWDLSLAAFNAGWAAVLRAIAKYNTNDFWALLELEAGLPWESSIYVPKALAASIVGHNLAAFGYADLAIAPDLEWDHVTVPTSVSIDVIARAAGTDRKTIDELNPQLRRGRTPPGVKDFVVRIPRGKKEQFARAFPELRGDWDGFDAYVLRWGERFEDVAKLHGITPEKLRALNGVTDTADLHGGSTLVVPHVDDATLEKNRAAAEADLYHSDVAPGAPDEPMVVAVPDKDAKVPGKRRVFYRVVPGDTIEDVAAVFGVRVADLADWNVVARDAKLQSRMVMVMWVAPDFDAAAAHVRLLDDDRLHVVTSGSAEHLDLIESHRGRKRIEIVAKKGDTLDSIGRHYGLNKYDLARINKRSYVRPLEPGETILVYEVVDHEKARKSGVYDKRHPDPGPSRRGKTGAATGKGTAAKSKSQDKGKGK